MKRKVEYIVEAESSNWLVVVSDFDSSFFEEIEGVRWAHEVLPGRISVHTDPRYDLEDVRQEIVRQLDAAILLKGD